MIRQKLTCLRKGDLFDGTSQIGQTSNDQTLEDDSEMLLDMGNSEIKVFVPISWQEPRRRWSSARWDAPKVGAIFQAQTGRQW